MQGKVVAITGASRGIGAAAARVFAAAGAKVALLARSEREIDGLAADIHGELPGVQDKVPAWLSTLKWWGIAVAGVAVAFMLWQSGAFTALRIAIGWLPRKSMVQAEMAADMLDPARPESEREFVAAMRARDPAFDAAYRKVKKGRQ